MGFSTIPQIFCIQEILHACDQLKYQWRHHCFLCRCVGNAATTRWTNVQPTANPAAVHTAAVATEWSTNAASSPSWWKWSQCKLPAPTAFSSVSTMDTFSTTTKHKRNATI